jgi:hypothetical protein
MKRGNIDDYRWLEFAKPDHVVLSDVVRQLTRYMIGCRALNVSWDSGLLLPSEPEADGWTFEQGRAISPAIGNALLKSWPYSGGCDEWYFFTELPTDLSLSPYCNWRDTSLSNWPSIADTPTGVDLRRQLHQSRPSVVLGQGYKTFAISSDAELVNECGRIITEAV